MFLIVFTFVLKNLNISNLKKKKNRKFWKQEMELTLVGIQNAGKTTLLNVISDGKAKDTIPTVGLNIRKIRKGMLDWCWSDNIFFRKTTTKTNKQTNR